MLDSHAPNSPLAVCATGGATEESAEEAAEVAAAEHEAAEVEQVEADVEWEGVAVAVAGCAGWARPPLVDSGSESPARCMREQHMHTRRDVRSQAT